jgi:hypothetical protein
VDDFLKAARRCPPTSPSPACHLVHPRPAPLLGEAACHHWEEERGRRRGGETGLGRNLKKMRRAGGRRRGSSDGLPRAEARVGRRPFGGSEVGGVHMGAGEGEEKRDGDWEGRSEARLVCPCSI